MIIRILVTGGTFDKEYNELDGTLFFKETHLPEMLRLGRSRVRAEIERLMMIDSLEMKDSDRARIVERCKSVLSRTSSLRTERTRWQKRHGRLVRRGFRRRLS